MRSRTTVEEVRAAFAAQGMVLPGLRFTRAGLFVAPRFRLCASGDLGGGWALTVGAVDGGMDNGMSVQGRTLDEVARRLAHELRTLRRMLADD